MKRLLLPLCALVPVMLMAQEPVPKQKPTLQGCDGYELAIAQHRARLARQGRGQLDDPMDDYLSESDMEPFDGNG